MRRIGQRLLHDKIEEGSGADNAASRDLLSLLVRANMSKDTSEAQRLSEEDVVARKCSPLDITCYSVDAKIEVPTFLVAGHETSALFTFPYLH